MKLLGKEKEIRDKMVGFRVSESEKKEIEDLATYVCTQVGIKPTVSNLLKLLVDYCFEENEGDDL